jgi:eukaryotic-like serine/threonine-protein kinase
MTATITCAGCQHAYIETALFCPNCGRPKVREALADPLLGKLLGERFLVQELLGQGGSGTIYRAEHVTLRRKVAIKALHTELSRDDLAVERFRREATTVAEIDNEHIVEIHDFGRTPDGRLYLAMELLEGETLDGVLAREHQLSIERAADVLIQVGEALMEAHAIGYVHRDLRPRNIYLSVRRGKANFIKLLDFGLAKLVETEGQAASTSLGMTFGDPKYMSPEQARGDRIDRRADIYQLGCVAYEMLTGAPPFSGNRVFDILTKQVTEAPQPLPTRRRGVPLWMEAAVTKMLAKDPDNRFATTTRMVEALRRGLETGEVMEDEVARRRESVPPPSVSRVMQRMGLQPSGEPMRPGSEVPGLPPLAQAQAAPAAPSAPSSAAPASAPIAAPRPPVVASPTAAPSASPAAGPSASPAATPSASPAAGPSASPAATPSSGPSAAAAVPAPKPPIIPAAAPAASPATVAAPVPARPISPPRDPAVTMRSPVAPPPGKPDSVELLRKRTGTPRVGVPVHGAQLPEQPPVAGVIDPNDAQPIDAPPARESGHSGSVLPPMFPDDAHARGKRHSGAPADLNISQVWYDEGDQLSDDDDEPAGRAKRARRTISPSTTDVAFYDEPPPRRWGLIAGIGAFVVIGATMAFALTRGGPGVPPASLASRDQPSATAAIDAAPSTILPSEPPGTEAAVPDAKDVKDAKAAAVAAAGKAPPAAAHHAIETHAPAARPPVETRAPAVRPPVETHASHPAATAGGFPVLGSEPTRHLPGAGAPPVATPADPIKRPSAPSLTDSPKDPYGAGDEAPSDGVAPEKKAEFFANLGGQQLIGGDTAGAAANFKKALELDGKNVAATMGMGEIALRQGLFGDAIAHLTKAAKLAPRSAKALTLLGEAYLNSGNNAQAAAQFKKALQLDPDNARARDGYNEASSRVPPPDDEAQ